jgi:hypothetical protein
MLAMSLHHLWPTGGARAAAVPAPFVAARLWTWFVLGFAIGAAFLFTPGVAHAGGLSEVGETFAGKVTDDPTAAKEIGNAFEALVEVLPESGQVARELSGGRRTIRPARGVSGPFQELVVNFDKMACAAWIVSYRDWLLGLMLKRDPETPPQTIAAAQNLLNKVIYGCRKVLDPESYQAGGTATGGGAPTTAPEAESGSATRVEVIDGELMISVSDNICWNMCRDRWLAWKGAAGTRQRAEDSMRDKRRTAEVLERDTIPWLERRLASAERQHADLVKRRPPYPRSDPAIDRQVAEKEAEIANLRTEVDAKKAEVGNLRAEGDALEQALPGLREAERAALEAYLDCLKRCKSMADSAQDPSSWADRTIGKLQPRLDALDRQAPPPARPAEDRRTSMAPPMAPESEQVLAARLEAITALRTGQAATSGTEVIPSIHGNFGPESGLARHDARDAAERSRYHDRHDVIEPMGQTPFVEAPAAMNEVPSEPVIFDPPSEPVGYPAPPSEVEWHEEW